MRHDELEGSGGTPPRHWKTIRDNAPPPVAQRPRCPNCHKPLRPRWVEVSKTGNAREGWVTHVEWQGGWNAYGHFCTLRCGCEYANVAIDRGR